VSFLCYTPTCLLRLMSLDTSTLCGLFPPSMVPPDYETHVACIPRLNPL